MTLVHRLDVKDGLVLIYGQNLIAQRRRSSSTGSEEVRTTRLIKFFGVLLVCEKEFRFGFGVEPLMLDIADDADDLPPDPAYSASFKAEPFSDNLFIRPVAARQRFVDDDGARRILAVLLCE